jgi:hypothetical protein
MYTFQSQIYYERGGIYALPFTSFYPESPRMTITTTSWPVVRGIGLEFTECGVLRTSENDDAALFSALSFTSVI